jgi:hypothetical protein
MLGLLRRLERRASSAIHKHALIYLPRTFERRDEPVTLVMPLALKDLHQAEASIASARKHLLHPIEETIIPGQSSTQIAAFCERVGAKYVDEEAFLPDSVKRFRHVTSGYNRNGWIRQQILKLSVDRIAKTRKCLILDSDTCLVRDLSFMRGTRPILFVADEYNETYHACIDRLLGPQLRYSRSFIAHCMLLDREVLDQLKRAIVLHCGMDWISAILDRIDPTLGASFSEYELYGTFVFNHAPEQFHTEYWYNRKYRFDGTTDPALLPDHCRKQNFVSNHVQLYNRSPIEVIKGP